LPQCFLRTLYLNPENLITFRGRRSLQDIHFFYANFIGVELVDPSLKAWRQRCCLTSGSLGAAKLLQSTRP